MMFFSNPIPQITSTIHVFPPSNPFLDHEKDDPYINHPYRSNNLNPFLSGDRFPATENFSASKNNLVEGLGLEQFFWPAVKNMKTSTKDHHCKIHTAQGPRDRRVRLSIDVAKKFFYLQDLLEFDKASKTLDWLFNKSKISIDELIKRKKQSSPSSVVTDQSEVIFMETGSDEQAKGRKKMCDEGKGKTIISRKYKSGLNQLRVKARARARERTKEKLNIKKLDNESKSVLVDCCSSNLTPQSSFWNSVESQNDFSDKIGESIMEDNISMLYSYQHNLVMSNESSSNNTCLPRFIDVHEQSGDYGNI